ncbi:DUF2310 family Zn-ribbon-containing protein [Aporhodopirellula aestuarii]|uniref:Zn-ribbon-containing protein n=1 Tax=Aporhodopirellula aestuarii TaxID=2950107 RepID=A0ABT0U645_9BACT|nr:DUF2310 family Zn-ribbon-containing protein [Aporhodopirellula aestuarii]MCM2372391.1 Zn-ribbon-containing protein [Aporhodopirellula aestuarii]
MFLSQGSFGKPRSDVDSEMVRDTLDGYLSALRKNGQICGEALHAVSGGSAIAYAYLVRPDSITRQYHSRYGIQDLDGVCELFGQEPSWQVLADEIPADFPDVRTASSLCLFPSAFDGQSPVCSMDTWDRFPTYLIPIDNDECERLCFWSREYNRMDDIWLSSGELEVPAYEQLASPSSLLSKQGRKLALAVESALHIPVYYFLMRYYGRGECESERRCPGCGKHWRRDTDTELTHFWNFPFRCEQCRLVSQFASASYDDSYAHIGEFQTKS